MNEWVTVWGTVLLTIGTFAVAGATIWLGVQAGRATKAQQETRKVSERTNELIFNQLMQGVFKTIAEARREEDAHVDYAVQLLGQWMGEPGFNYKEPVRTVLEKHAERGKAAIAEGKSPPLHMLLAWKIIECNTAR